MTDQLGSIHTNRYFWYILTTLVLLNLAIHIPYLLLENFGEPDAARLAINSFQASTGTGDLTGSNQQPAYSAPLYALALRLGIRSGLLTPSNIIPWMTLFSFLASALATAMVVLILRELTGSVWPALGAGLVLQFVPVFWFNSIYGFPTICAVSLLLISLVFFQFAFEIDALYLSIVLGLCGSIFFMLSVLTKVDILFGGMILCLPIWRSSISKKRKIVWMGFLIVLALVSLVLYSQVTRGMVPDQTTGEFFNDWNSAFSIDWSYFFSKLNIEIILRAVGFLTIPIAAIALILLSRDRKYRAALFWLAMSIIPIMIFWGTRVGNSARHNLIPAIFLVVLLALPLATAYRKIWGLILFFTCVINYFWFAPTNLPNYASGRLIITSMLIKHNITLMKQKGEIISELPERKIALIGRGPAQEYYKYELFRNNEFVYVDTKISPISQNVRMIFEYRNQRKNYIFFYSIPPIPEIAELIDQGYYVLVDDLNTKAELKKIPHIQGRWINVSELE